VSFTDQEARLNSSAMQRLSNARGSWDGGATDFPIIFDRAQVNVMGGEISGNMPVASVADSDAAGRVANASRITIRGVDYIVRGMQPDSTGWTDLVLEAA
jgi:hypothetical protein